MDIDDTESKQDIANSGGGSSSIHLCYCICGEFLFVTTPLIYGINANPYCNVCQRSIKSNEILYHCNKIDSIFHLNGYDLCEQCSKHNITANVNLSHLFDVFGNGNQRKIELIPKLCREREGYSAKICMLQKQTTYYTNALKQLSSSSNEDVPSPGTVVVNDAMNEVLGLYGTLICEMVNDPSLLSSIFYSTKYKDIDAKIDLLTNSLFSNPFNLSHEYLLTHVIVENIEYEWQQTKDLTTILRENSPATKLFSAYLKRENIAMFINGIVEESCKYCLVDYTEDIDIEPSANENDENNIEERKKKLIKYTDFILSTAMNVSRYPQSLRIICRKLQDLAVSKDANNSVLRNSLIGGFVFLRMINPKIAIYGHTKSTQKPYKKYSKLIKRKFTLIVKILQNISNQNESKHKEKWMTVMNEYVCSKHKDVNLFFAELCSVSMDSFCSLYLRMIYHSPLRESVYVSVKELNTLITTYHNVYAEKAKQEQNKCFYELLSFIVQKDAFCKEAHENANFIKIRIPKMKLTNERSDIEKNTEMEIKSKVIPVLAKLSENANLLKNIGQSGDLLTDIIAVFQYAYASKENIENLEETIIYLANHSNQTVVEKVILRLYAECESNLKIFNRLNQEITEMMFYQQSLFENVSLLSTKFDNQRNKPVTSQHKKFFNLKNVPELIKDNINSAVSNINANIKVNK